MSAAQYLSLGPTEQRFELIDGVVVMSPSPSDTHQRILRLIQRQLEYFIDDHPGFDYLPDVDFRLSESKVYTPDSACFSPGRLPAGERDVSVPVRGDTLPSSAMPGLTLDLRPIRALVQR